MADGRTIVFFPEGAYGPTNNCAGIGNVLRARGHRVVFIVEESFAGNLEAKGFEERLMRLGPAARGAGGPRPVLDRLHPRHGARLPQADDRAAGRVHRPHVPGARSTARSTSQPRLAEIVDELDPAVIVEDNVVSFPAIMSTGPAVGPARCRATRRSSRTRPVAPFSSGYPAADRSAWPAFLEEVRRTHGELWADFDAFCREQGAGGLAWGEHGPDFMHESPWLNAYSYPREADYERATPLGPTWHQLDSTVRAPRHVVPARRAGRARDGALIYLSLGSLGSADVGLMQRLVDLLGRTDHRVIVSKGPLADQITLHDNMTGEGFLPQPAILPQVDLVITHGGNNTVVESFHHGKPMIVLPLFWDQVDNAQRVHETGFGRRLATYDFEDAELTDGDRRAARGHGRCGRGWRRSPRACRRPTGRRGPRTSSSGSR